MYLGSSLCKNQTLRISVLQYYNVSFRMDLCLNSQKDRQAKIKSLSIISYGRIIEQYMKNCEVQHKALWIYMYMYLGCSLYKNKALRISVLQYYNVTFRMDLCFERQESLLQSMKANQLVLEDRENYIYSLPGIDCYGTKLPVLLFHCKRYWSGTWTPSPNLI